MCSIYSVKVVHLFPTNMKLHLCQKSKDDFLPKNTSIDDISDITEKHGTYPKTDDIGILDWHSSKSSNNLFTFMDTFLFVFVYYFPMKTTWNLIYRIESWLYL